MPSVYLANIHTELAGKGVLRNITNLPRPSAEWRFLPPLDDSKIDDTVRDAKATLSYVHECANSKSHDLVFVDAAVIRSANNPSVAAGAIVTWDTHTDGHTEYTEQFDLKPGTSALQAETEALLRALQQIDIATTTKQTLVFTDCLQLVKNLKNGRVTTKQAFEAYELIQKLDVKLQHVRGHRNLPGNTLADQLASKQAKAAHRQASDRRKSLTKCKSELAHDDYVKQLKEAVAPPLRSPDLQKFIGSYKHCKAYVRLLTNATFLKDHGHKIGKESDANCADCGSPDSIEHFLHECPAYRRHRTQPLRTTRQKVNFIVATGKKF